MLLKNISRQVKTPRLLNFVCMTIFYKHVYEKERNLKKKVKLSIIILVLCFLQNTVHVNHALGSSGKDIFVSRYCNMALMLLVINPSQLQVTKSQRWKDCGNFGAPVR